MKCLLYFRTAAYWGTVESTVLNIPSHARDDCVSHEYVQTGFEGKAKHQVCLFILFPKDDSELPLYTDWHLASKPT